MKKTTEELMEILKQKKSIHAYFTEEIDELEFASLAEYLELLLNEKGLRKSDVIKRSNMDKNYAYQIFNGNKTHPSRDKMIALAIGMGLNVMETRKLLRSPALVTCMPATRGTAYSSIACIKDPA